MFVCLFIQVMKYEDLPFMGEMTLDNVKPRRGRKPKKADICHLIYKNYGTILTPSVPAAQPPLQPAIHLTQVLEPLFISLKQSF